MPNVVKIDNKNFEKTIDKASQIIKDGGTVIFPTETVYGLGANALDEKSSSKIYKAKGRPSDNPLIVHISDISQVYNLAKDISLKAKILMDNFWPGPLTIILKKKDIVPYKTTGGLDTIAVRFPNHKVARELIKKSRLPIAAPSANISGKPSLTDEINLVQEMQDKVDMIILSENSEIGLESTVIDATESRICILRPGYIDKSDIEQVLGEEIYIDVHLNDKNQTPKSPGMKYKHYSPKCQIVVVDGADEEIINKIKINTKKDKEKKVNYLILARRDFDINDENVRIIGKDNLEIAHNLFETFRKLDTEKIEKAYFPYIKDGKFAYAIMDRVKKASGYNII